MTDAVDAIKEQATVIWTGGPAEVRILNTPRGTVSGYFDNPDDLARAAARWNGKAPGIYQTLNPVKPALMARANNHLIERAKTTTADTDIIARHWLPLDFDPVRPAGISSTDEEHALARGRAKQAGKWLVALGIARESIVFADSGNGAHLLIRIDLPNNPESDAIVRKCLEAVSIRFSDDRVAVDLTSGNAARIWKVYGTVAAKGDNTAERPHRTAEILQDLCPATITALDVLEVLARFAPPAPPTSRPVESRTGFNIDDFIARHLAGKVISSGPWQTGRKWVTECPFDPSHTDRSAVIIEHASGALSFRCHHNGCSGRSWHDVREMFEPKVPRVSAAPRKCERQPNPEPPPARTAPNVLASPPKVRLVTKSMADVALEEINWLWDRRIPRGKLTLVDGDPEARKTWLLLAIAAAISRGWPLPGETGHKEPGRVLLLAGEDGLGDTIKPRLVAMGADETRIEAVVGLLREDDQEPLTLDADGITALTAKVEEYRPDAVLIDPLLAYSGGGIDINKANEVRAMLRPLTDMAQKYSPALVSTRHLNKALTAPAAYRGQGSMDYRAAARASLFVVVDPDDEQRSIVMPHKNNLSEKGKGWGYRIGPGPNGPTVLWDGEVEMSLDELLQMTAEPQARKRTEEAKAFLTEVLFEGPLAGNEIKKQASQAGISDRTLERAKHTLGVRSRKPHTPNSPWTWELPNIEDGDVVPNPYTSELNESKAAKAANFGAVGDVGGLPPVVRTPYKNDDDDEELF